MLAGMEKLLREHQDNCTCPDECSPVFAISGEKLFPFRLKRSDGNLSEVFIGYRCPYCGSVVAYHNLPLFLATYLKGNRQVAILEK